MAATPRHTYQVLTKRPKRAHLLLQSINNPPVLNVWIGVSVEDSQRTDRIPVLREVPAAVRFLSCEPRLGPLASLDLAGIDWVIVGGESSVDARPTHEARVTAIHADRVAAGLAFFFTQWGSYAQGWWAPPRGPDLERNATHSAEAGRCQPDSRSPGDSGPSVSTRFSRTICLRSLGPPRCSPRQDRRHRRLRWHGHRRCRITGLEFDASARLALKTTPPFTRLLLCERPRRAFLLDQALRRDFPDRIGDFEVVPGDCNQEIPVSMGAVMALQRLRW
jgi:hypothetical protein